MWGRTGRSCSETGAVVTRRPEHVVALVPAVEVGGDGNVGAMSPGNWHHIAVVWAPEDHSFRLYRNGTLLVAEQTLAAPTFSSGTAWLSPKLYNSESDRFL